VYCLVVGIKTPWHELKLDDDDNDNDDDDEDEDIFEEVYLSYTQAIQYHPLNIIYIDTFISILFWSARSSIRPLYFYT
jgi:hypothetical protein